VKIAVIGKRLGYAVCHVRGQGGDLLHHVQTGKCHPALAFRAGEGKVLRVQGQKGNEVPGL